MQHRCVLMEVDMDAVVGGARHPPDPLTMLRRRPGNVRPAKQAWAGARAGFRALLDSSVWEPLNIIKSKGHFGVQRAGLHHFFVPVAKNLAGLRAGLAPPPESSRGFLHTL